MTRTRRRRAGIDVAVLAILAAVVSLVSVRLGLGTRLSDSLEGVGPVDGDALLAVALVIALAAVVLAVRRSREARDARAELTELALYDALTGLPNRIFLAEWLGRELTASRRAGTRVAVLFVDVDRFKLINDTHGHEVGDALLVTLADRLRSCVVDPTDRVVRLSGDEFVVVCHDDPLKPRATIRLARRIVSALEEPFEVGRESLRIAASIGVAVSTPQGTSEQLLRDADSAMYHAKARGDGRPVVFDPTVHGNRFTPATLEPQLRAAARQRDFRLVYQPVVDVATGDIVAVETLLRWDHPERGAISPAEFVPVLEDTGLIVDVGAWIIREAIAQAHRWHEENPDRAPLRVTVNVSARQLAQSGFERTVREALQATPVPPGALCLELTEGALMVDIDAAWSALRLLKRLGVKLALDDFGTGYSSLSYIRRFSLDMLKIDRSFVEGLGTSAEDTAIVEHVIGMARGLGMVTVGEGVETPLQLGELHRLGCELAQGFLLSRPLPAEEIGELLARGEGLGRPADDEREPQVTDGDRSPLRGVGAVPFSAVDRAPGATVSILR